MQTIKKMNTDFYLKVGSTDNLYNIPTGQFKGVLINEADGSTTTITNPFSEIVVAVDGNTSTLTGDVPANSKFLPVSDGTQFVDGDVIEINSNYYYIENISGNVLEIREKSAGHTSGDTVTQVGNTGIYKVLMNINALGLYTVLISNKAINMQNTPISIEIVDNVVSDIIKQSKQKSFI